MDRPRRRLRVVAPLQVSVDAIERLARKHLTDEQLIELMARLEVELLGRAMPTEDTLVDEHPHWGRVRWTAPLD